jgi:16S rRNA (cytosine1402-N4)-methyltransferase
MMSYHNPVMLKEAIDALEIKSTGVYVDVTYGGGGHSAEILKRLGKNGRLIAFDKDLDAQRNKNTDKRLFFVDQDFKYLENYISFFGFSKIDGLLADLGVSSHQFDLAERGFSFRFESMLDMRMDQRNKQTASRILQEYSEKDLADMFFNFGELRNARKIAATIVSHRKKQALKSNKDLYECLLPFIPKMQEHKFLAKVYQAIRIELNEEMESLKEMLLATTKVIKTGGNLVVLSYHSIEDRLVKNFIKTGNFKGEAEKDFFGKPIKPFESNNNKAITAGDEEIKNNNRARSAKLRIAKKL